MEMIQEFTVRLGIAEAWALFTDLERIAPCMPGAQLTEVNGDQYTGLVKVKVGPVTAQYTGVASFVEKDDANHRAVIKAAGKDTRGQGNANATVTAQLTEVEGGTKANVVIDLAISGKVAQFGKGVIVDVSTKLLKVFVECLEAKLAAEGALGAEAGAATPVAPAAAPAPAGEAAPAPTAVPAAAAASVPRKIDMPEAQPVQLVEAAGGAVLKRLIPLVLLIAAIVVVWIAVR